MSGPKLVVMHAAARMADRRHRGVAFHGEIAHALVQERGQVRALHHLAPHTGRADPHRALYPSCGTMKSPGHFFQWLRHTTLRLAGAIGRPGPIPSSTTPPTMTRPIGRGKGRAWTDRKS